MELKEGDVAMCTVKKIEGATVFLDVEGNGEGSMVMSEVAAGRIRNLREYVVPNKKIVCKILRITNGHPQLSLRRVTAREREEIQDKYQKERTFKSILKTIAKSPEKIIEKIEKELELWKFFDLAKEDSSLIKKFFPEKEALELARLLAEKKEREKIAKKTFSIKSLSPGGINDIKSALAQANLEIHYLGSSKFSISATGKDFREANSKVTISLEKIKSKAKEKKLIFESDEK